MDGERIYADLMKWDQNDDEDLRRVILTCRSTFEDLKRNNLKFEQGKTYRFWMDDSDDEGNFDPLHFDGEVQFDQKRNCWVALIDWGLIVNKSETE